MPTNTTRLRAMPAADQADNVHRARRIRPKVAVVVRPADGFAGAARTGNHTRCLIGICSVANC